MDRFTPILSITIVLSCFYQLISHFQNLSTWISRLPFAVNTKTNANESVFTGETASAESNVTISQVF